MIPDYSMNPGETDLKNLMLDFIGYVRSRGRASCHVDRAFEEAVTITMSVESYHRQRKVWWNAEKEEIDPV